MMTTELVAIQGLARTGHANSGEGGIRTHGKISLTRL